MQFCYTNATGLDRGRYVVMVGLLIGSGQRHLASYSWKQFLNVCSDPAVDLLQNFHADRRDGYQIWKSLYSDDVDSPIEAVLDWVLDGGYPVVFGVVDRQQFIHRRSRGELPREIDSEWSVLGLQLALSVEKYYRDSPVDDRSTLFMFDRSLQDAVHRFERLTTEPPGWTDSYYGKNTPYPGLEHVVGAPVFAGPDHSALVQIPYLIGILIRRYIEMQANDTLGTSVTEVKNVHRWFGQITDRCLEYPYSKAANQDAAGLFRALAPPALRQDGARATAPNLPPEQVVVSVDTDLDHGQSGAA
jgi:hypothetical protein